MSTLAVNEDLLREFEAGLDPRWPEHSTIPATVLGHGEISTVFEIEAESEPRLAYKRLPMFKAEAEIDQYERLYRAYEGVLRDRIGVHVVPSGMARVQSREGRPVLYLVQGKLPVESIGHKVIHHLSGEDVKAFVLAILHQTEKVYRFNEEHRGELEIGFDAQISNWSIVDFQIGDPRWRQGTALAYFDTSTPLMRRGGEEQLDPELFLRSAPSFLVWILRTLFLEDVMTRYYDFRKVAVDLIANFYKEQKPELIPELVEVVNGFAEDPVQGGGLEPLTVREVASYYREDVWIWRSYLSFRKVDRFLHQLVGKYYPYVLPERIRR